MPSARIERLVLAALLVLGLLVTLANRAQPLVRNSLVYARASENVIAHGYDPRPVVADSKLSYDKPILYAWFSAPFVAALGNHDGLRLTSLLTTAAYLFALLHFARSFRSLLPEGGAALLLWLAAFGPCVAYQFWSAHPDGWFAALVVLAWSLTQRLVTGELRPVRGMLWLGAVLYVAILLKNYGLVLLVSCPAYLLWHLRPLRADRERFGRLLWSGIGVFGALGLLAWLAWIGMNPLSRLEGEGGGVGQYATGELARSAKGTWVALGLALLLQFQLALVLATRRAAWSRALVAPLTCFAAPYVLGLMPFPTTFYNMRYFVPLFPLAGLVLARGWSAFGEEWRRRTLVAHGLVAVLLVVVFNWAPAYRAARPSIPTLEVNWIGVPLSLLDNLRMPQHLDQAEVLANLDRAVPPGATLYMLDVKYYVDAQQGVYERAGLIRADIATRYASSSGFEPAEADCYVWSPRPQHLESLGEVEDLGQGLVHLRRG
jgi:hypothetical protein